MSRLSLSHRVCHWLTVSSPWTVNIEMVHSYFPDDSKEALHNVLRRFVAAGALRVVDTKRPKVYAVVDMTRVTPQRHHTRRLT